MDGRVMATWLRPSFLTTMAPERPPSPPTQGAGDDRLHVVRTSRVHDEIFPTGGVVYPPPDLRPVIDKTAEFVARNGVAFEAKIREQERLNPKFAFLQADDAYNSYFRMQIRAAAERSHGDTQAAASSERAASAVQAALLADRSERPVDEEPPRPAPHAFSLEFPSTPAVELDVLKLTALWAARQGPSFTARLMAREQHTYQFGFLHPAHPLCSYFHLVTEQYRRVMQPSQACIDTVRRCASRRCGPGAGGARLAVLDEVRKRAAWTRWDDARRHEVREEEARQRALFDEIDWQDFCVVGVVEVTGSDVRADLPPPTSLAALQHQLAAQEQVQAMERTQPAPAPAPEERSEPPRTRPAEAPAPEAPSVTITASGAKIRHDYVRHARAPRAAPQTTVCPVCGDRVDVNEMSEHVRIELLNPQYREQRASLEQRRQEQASLAAGADPSHYLRQLAGARTDLFGAREDEETRTRHEAAERERAREKEKRVWDGHMNSRRTAQQAQAAEGPPGDAGRGKRASSEALPPPKRAALAAPTYAESEWLAMYPHPITLHVRVPAAPQIAPVCDGHTEVLSGLPLTTTIGHVRDRILHDTLHQAVGASKLKMWVHGRPATLRQSLAYWNLADGAHVEMSVGK